MVLEVCIAKLVLEVKTNSTKFNFESNVLIHLGWFVYFFYIMQKIDGKIPLEPELLKKISVYCSHEDFNNLTNACCCLVSSGLMILRRTPCIVTGPQVSRSSSEQHFLVLFDKYAVTSLTW